jgi:urea transporter
MSDVIKPIDAAAANPMEMKGFVEGVVKSISQVFLSESILAALLLLAGLAVNSIPAAVLAVAGAMVAVITAHVLGAESNLITGGLLGFSPVLTAIALGAVFYKPCAKVALYALVATIFTVVAQSAMNALFTPFGIPALTAPFVLVTWLFLLPRQKFDPAQAS